MALVLGALLAIAVELPHRVIAAVMGFGSGVLVNVLATQLIQESVEAGKLAATLDGFMAGAAVFSGANWLLFPSAAPITATAAAGAFGNPAKTRRPAAGWPFPSEHCSTAFPSR